ncbi:MAG: hypothetical protein ABUJ92_00305 [Desulfobacterales bacterium]
MTPAAQAAINAVISEHHGKPITFANIKSMLIRVVGEAKKEGYKEGVKSSIQALNKL